VEAQTLSDQMFPLVEGGLEEAEEPEEVGSEEVEVLAEEVVGAGVKVSFRSPYTLSFFNY
jgi:hypothetical protein